MQKKRSVGVTIFGILAIIFSISMLFSLIPVFTKFIFVDVQTKLQIISSFCWLIFGIGILMRLGWARIGIIIVAIYYVIDTFNPPIHFWKAITNAEIFSLITIAIGLAFFCSTIFYFTRPKVKRQFTGA